ncbi:ComF family protein [Aurantibacter sp.]|uniref:ComF family protein n=1 Tax=Aurantibacter sp. TaxID=2807103 RepID=UPI0035C82AFE
MLKALFNLFFPEVCLACIQPLLDNELTICTNCRHHLPVTNFHYNKTINLVHKALYGRAEIVNATSLFYFEKKSIVQQLIHQLKYKNQPEISNFLGNWLGSELSNCKAYEAIDVVIPVPLHYKKLKKRGYNQVEGFGKSIANHLKCNYLENVLVKTINTSSQVKKTRLERWQLKEELFTTQNLDLIKGKHILLVDDIITTGSTLENCITELNKAQNIKISIAVMAIA